jgi:RNA polymerase sigma factor (sigma-70 family)
MSDIELQSRRGEASDAELISRVRGGDVSAYGDLFARHRDAATRLARQLVSSADADDLVSEAFAKVLNVLLGGGGPDIAFRAYLLTAVRRLHVDKIRSTARATPTDDLTPYDAGEPFADTVIADFEGAAAARAFASLPERWQLVLWHLEIEGQKPADVAPLLGMSPNAVSALAYRAREGLRQAYLQSHAADLAGEDCRWTHDRLGAYVRKGLSRRDAHKVEAHLESCRTCTAAYLDLAEVNASLAGLLGPLVLGSAATGYLSASATGGNSALTAAILRVKEAAQANGQVVAGIAGAVGVAGLTAVAFAVTGGGSNAPQATDQTPNITTHIPGPVTPTPTPTPSSHPTPSSPVPTFTVAPPTSSNPKPSKPTHTPSSPSTPTTPPTTPTTPPITPPVTPTSDVGVTLDFRLGLGLLDSSSGTLGNLKATVTGVPTGQLATITIQTLGGVLQPVTATSSSARGTTSGAPNCVVSGATTTCKVGGGTQLLTFKLQGLPVSAVANVSAPASYQDPNMKNNHASMLLGLLH